MDIRHYQGVVADFSDTLAACLRASVDGGTFADGHIVPDFHICYFSVKFEVLWDSSHNCSRKYGTILTYFDIRKDGCVRINLAVVPNLYILIDICIRTYFYVFSEFCLGADSCQRMNRC